MAGAPLLLVLASWFLLMLAENCRIPFDDPNTHLELTMIHEVIVLDHSGPMLALIATGRRAQAVHVRVAGGAAGRAARLSAMPGSTGRCSSWPCAWSWRCCWASWSR